MTAFFVIAREQSDRSNLMVVGKKGELSMVNNPRGKQIELLEKTGINLEFPGS